MLTASLGKGNKHVLRVNKRVELLEQEIKESEEPEEEEELG
jgi:hypothetical protein